MKVNNKKNILLVEDEIMIAMGKRQELEKYGYTVLHVNTGEKAVQISKGNNDIDLILMDIDLGKGIDGTEAAELILQDHKTPIVFLSSHIDSEVVKKAEKITSYGYVVKSSSITVLDASIKMALKLFNTTKKLQTSEEKFRASFVSNFDSISVSDMNGIFIDMNDRFSLLTGFTREEIIGSKSFDLDVWTIPSDKEKLIKELKKTGNVENFESVFKHKDGTLKTALISAHIINIDNKPHILSITHDITEQKELQNKLETNLYYLSKAQDVGKIGTWEFDFQTNISKWTDENYKIFGIPLGTQITSELFLGSIHPDDRDYVDEKWKATLNNEPYDIEYRIIVNNEVKWIRAKAEIKIDKKGNLIKVIGFAQDITEFKLIQDKLLKSEKRYKNDEKIAHIGNWEYDVEKEILWASDECKRIFGFDLELLEFSVDEIEICISERERVHQALIDLIQEGKEYELEYEIHPRNSIESRTIWSIADIDRDKNGAPLIVYGVIQDITNRKRTEDLLISNEAKYKQMFQTNTAIKLIIDPDDGQLVEVNDAASKFYGYDKQKLGSMNINDINMISQDEVKLEMEYAKKEKRLYLTSNID